MAEVNPLKLVDQGGGVGALAEFGAGDTLPKATLPPLEVADVSGLSTALAGKVGTSDARLTDAREWTAGSVAQAEAEAGTATTRRAWTAERVRQAILGWWNSSAFKTKLDGIQAGATANATDAQLRDRATHTGVQAISTVTGLQTALDAKQPSAANLSALSDLTGAADKGVHFTGAGAMAVHDQTPFARTLLDDANAETARATLGLGSAATRTALGSTGSLYSRDSILGTVSQSAGVPTGAIIERGSNANGEYVRFADGTQICTHTILTNNVNTYGVNSWWGSDAFLWTLPAAFSSSLSVYATAHSSDGSGASYLACMFYPETLPNGGGQWRTLSPDNVSAPSYLTLFAIGRWY